MEIPQIYGTILEMKKKANFIYILCEKDLIYSLLMYNLQTDDVEPIIRVSDLKYLEFKLKERLEMNGYE